MSSTYQNQNKNNNKEREHKVLSIKDRSYTICGISRYEQLQNKKNLDKSGRKRITRLYKSKTLGFDRLMINNNNNNKIINLLK